MRRAIPAFFASCLAAVCGLVALGQDVTGPAGTYTVRTPAPATVTQGAGWIKFEWAVTPTPTPTPDPPPPPVPTPVIKYAGRLYVSFVAPGAPGQDHVAFRAAMAAVDWSGLDATYRSYLATEPAVAELRLLGDRTPPFVVIQHQRPGTKVTDPAPIVDEIAWPATVDVVKARIARLRGAR